MYIIVVEFTILISVCWNETETSVSSDLSSTTLREGLVQTAEEVPCRALPYLDPRGTLPRPA